MCSSGIEFGESSSASVLRNRAEESLAGTVLDCLSNPQNIESNRSKLRQEASQVFLNVSINHAVVPDVLLEGLCALAAFPSISSDVAHCLLLLATSTPSAWISVSSSTAYKRHALILAILNAFTTKPSDYAPEFSRCHERLLTRLRCFSNLDFWEQRSFLVCAPRTPFYFAVQAALRSLEIAVASLNVFKGAKDPQNVPVEVKAPVENALCRLRELTLCSAINDWESLPDSYILHVARAVGTKESSVLSCRLSAVCSEEVRSLQCGTKHAPSEHLVLSPYFSSFSERNNSFDVSSKGKAETALLNVLSSIPEMADLLGYHPETSTDDMSELTRLSTESQTDVESKLDVVCSAVVTILTGISDNSSLYTNRPLRALQLLLQLIARHAGKKCVIDEAMIVEGLKFLLEEGRGSNGVPSLFAPIANPLLTIVELAFPFQNGDKVLSMIRSIVRGRATCEEIKHCALNLLQRFETKNNSLETGEKLT